MHQHILISIGLIGFLSIACQWFAWWVRLPAIVFLLITGIIVGPVTGLLDPGELFGELLFPMVSVAVAIILFDGSLSLKLNEIRGLESVVRKLVTSGVVVTWLVTTLATRFILGVSWEFAALFGAITVVTGPTVIVPLLRSVRPNRQISNILRWEGIVIDPIGALLAVITFEFIMSTRAGGLLSHTFIAFGQIIGVGMAMGIFFAWGLGEILRRHLMPEYLHNVATLTIVIGAFALSNFLQEESGLLTVTVMGMWLANKPGVDVEGIRDFKESLSVLLISALFIILAARLNFDQFVALGWAAVWIVVVMQFVARPVKILLSTRGSSLSWQEKAMLSWIAPRGIVAAAISALFAIRLQEAGFDDAQYLVPLTFMVIIGTVMLQGATARPIAVWLKVADPEPRGFLIVGANLVSRTIAESLNKQLCRVVLADTNWDNISAARLKGLDTYFGNVVSEHADHHLNLIGLGRLIALSPHRELNALACLRYRPEFGQKSIYTVQTAVEAASLKQHKIDKPGQAEMLFRADVTYSKLASLISKGAEMHTTHLTDSFGYSHYLNQYAEGAIPMFAIDPKGRIYVYSPGTRLTPSKGWSIMTLVEKVTENTGSRFVDTSEA